MLSEIKAFFEKSMSADAEGDLDHKLQLATAALLIEMTKQDDQIDSVEVDTVKQVLVTHFDLTVSECEDLFALAEKEAADAVGYYQFTSLIAKQWTQTQKVQIIEFLWCVAYADQKLDALEEHMVRKISDLIYVSHKDFIQAKHRAQNKLGTE